MVQYLYEYQFCNEGRDFSQRIKNYETSDKMINKKNNQIKNFIKYAILCIGR